MVKKKKCWHLVETTLHVYHEGITETSSLFCHPIFTHRAPHYPPVWCGKAATVTLSCLSVTCGSYRSGNPLWSSSILPPSCSCSRANRGRASPAAAQLLKTAQHLLRGRDLCSVGWLRKGRSNGKTRGQLVAGVKMSNRRWLDDRRLSRSLFWPIKTLDSGDKTHFSVLLVWSFGPSWRIYLEKEIWILHGEFGCFFF